MQPAAAVCLFSIFIFGGVHELDCKAFCELRGILSSVRKQGRGILESLKDLIVSPAKLGKSLASAKWA
jgi:hypothetical protein